MKLSCLLCKTELDSFHVFPKKALFTKALKSARPDAVADMGVAYCPQCRHISSRLSTSFPLDELSRITYQELYDNFVPTDLSPSQKSFTDFVGRWMGKHIPRGAHILEIGSHDGYLLNLLQRQGYKCEGVEPSPFADYSREHYGLSVIKDFFRAEQFPANSFDVVILRHVVEHLQDPQALVQESMKVLKNGGLLYVEVPNSFGSLQEKFFPEFHADHISYFTMPSMLTLLARCGVTDIVNQESVVAYMKFPFLSVLGRKGNRAADARPAGGWFLDFRITHIIESFSAAYQLYLDNLRELRANRSLVVWGTGSIGIQYAIDAGWSTDDVQYVDINPKNQGLVLSVTGHRIESPAFIQMSKPELVLIASGWEDDVRQQLRSFLPPSTEVIGYTDLLRRRS